MRLLKRIKTLWKLSELEVSIKDKKIHIDFVPQEHKEERPKMAQIIKTRDRVKEILENNEI